MRRCPAATSCASRGPNVFRGYLGRTRRAPAATRKTSTAWAMRCDSSTRSGPPRACCSRGRFAEDFKLGQWHLGAHRGPAHAAARMPARRCCARRSSLARGANAWWRSPGWTRMRRRRRWACRVSGGRVSCQRSRRAAGAVGQRLAAGQRGLTASSLRVERLHRRVRPVVAGSL